MSCTKEPWLITRFLNDQINSSIVRPQDAISGLSAIAVKSSGNLKAWEFLKQNWDLLFSKYI